MNLSPVGNDSDGRMKDRNASTLAKRDRSRIWMEGFIIIIIRDMPLLLNEFVIMMLPQQFNLETVHQVSFS